MNPSSEQVKKKAASLSIKTMIIIAVFILACLGFGFIADEMVLEKEKAFDLWAFDKLKLMTNDRATAFMTMITFLGSSYFLFPAYLVLAVIYLLRREWRYSLNIAAVGIWSAIILLFLKTFFHRLRPADPLITQVAGFSFPSGHSFSSFTFFGLLIYITAKSKFPLVLKWAVSILLFLIALLVALSRVYLHVHYASDVIAGFFLAAVWLIASFAVLKKIDTSLRHTGTGVPDPREKKKRTA